MAEGEWEGTLKCTTTVAGVVTKTKIAETVSITTFDGSLAVVLGATNLTLVGSAIPDDQSDATGVVRLTAKRVSATPPAPADCDV